MRRNADIQPPTVNLRAAGGAITATVLVIAVLIIAAASFVNIQPGYVGVLFDAQAHDVTAGFLQPVPNRSTVARRRAWSRR